MSDPGGTAGLRTLVAERDWATTPLGAFDGWSEALRTTVATCLGSRFPVMVFWGEELVQIYNDAYAPIIGTKHPAALGQTAAECFPEIWEVIGPMLHGVLAAGQATWSDDLMLVLAAGGDPEECYFTFSFGPAGADPIRGVFCAVLETTHRVVERRRDELLRELATDLAELKDPLEVLGRAAAILGEHREDIQGGHLLLHAGGERPGVTWPSELAPRARAEVERVARGASGTGELDVVRVDPSPPGESAAQMVLTAVPLTRPGGTEQVATLGLVLNPQVPFDADFRGFLEQMVRTVGVAYAVAEGHDAERRRALALEEVDRAKTAFLSNVSHEFRTPLTLLLGPLEALQQDVRLPADVHADLLLAERNARRVLKLVNSLLDVSRLEAGRVSATFQPTDLAVLTADLAGVFGSAATAAGLELVIDCAPIAEAVYVDREMWEQIVFNLCANAIKFTPSGSVTVRLYQRGEGACLEVTDTGVGIAPDDLPFIFDRFRRGLHAEAASRSGTGLGLALVRELVVLHGGTVEVQSVLWEGATFTVTVPLGTAHLDAERVASASLRAARALSTSAGETVGLLADADLPIEVVQATFRSVQSSVLPPEDTRSMVWVVDDNADMREYLERLLGQFLRVITFPNATSVFAFQGGGLPDLILSDVTMPGPSGLDLVGALRAEPLLSEIPVILLSARAGEEAALEGLEAGADDYIVKPFTARELVGRIESHLRLAAIRRQAREEATRHASHLESLTGAATLVVAAESFAEIVRCVEEFTLELAGVTSCRVVLDDAGDDAPPRAPVAVPDHFVMPLVGGDGSRLGRIEFEVDRAATFGDDDLELVARLALIASRRISHLVEYRREHSVSHALQRSLLPDALPRLDGVELVARYRPATANDEVGGDWYDALVLPDGRLMVTVGDVAGHDLQAATVMGQLRLMLRTRAAEHQSPAELCKTVNHLLPIVGIAKMATMALAFIDVESGRAMFVNAGHPQPVLWSEQGTTVVDVPPYPPLGASLDSEYRDTEVTLPERSTLLLYTDGLIERRNEPLDEAVARLCERVEARMGGDLEGSVSLLIADLIDEEATDDVVLFGLRRD